MGHSVQAVSKGASEYEQFYVPEMEARRKEKADLEARRRKVGMGLFFKFVRYHAKKEAHRLKAAMCWDGMLKWVHMCI
eukprot:scaffold195208_cov14-Tisochrysis_lutea.AAC.1